MEQAQITQPTVGIEDIDGVKTFNFGNGVRASYPFTKLFAALVKAHGQIQNAPRSEKGQDGNRNYFYADLAAIQEASKKALTDNELGVSQHPSQINGASVTVTTFIVHSSGEWLTSSLTITAEKTGPKAIGSAITYARRYAKQAIFDIVTEDDDAAGATRGKEEPPQNEQQRRLAPPPKNDSSQKSPQQQQQAGADHLSPEHINQAKEAQQREHERNAPLRALKNTLHVAYHCQTPEDADLLLAYATGDRSKTVGWLNNNPDKATEIAEAISKWATDNNMKPEETLMLIRKTETSREAFPS